MTQELSPTGHGTSHVDRHRLRREERRYAHPDVRTLFAKNLKVLGLQFGFDADTMAKATGCTVAELTPSFRDSSCHLSFPHAALVAEYIRQKCHVGFDTLMTIDLALRYSAPRVPSMR